MTSSGPDDEGAQRPDGDGRDAVADPSTLDPVQGVREAEREAARREKLREAMFGEGDAATREEERRREQELLRDVPPHHG